MVESGRRDGSAVATAVYGWLLSSLFLPSSVVVSPDGVVGIGRGKRVTWTSRLLGQVGRQQRSGCTVGGCCCSGSKVQAAEVKAGGSLLAV